MPLYLKIPGYIGNAALFLLCIVMLFTQAAVVGVLLGALSVFNLFLVYKLDQFSRPEAWLEHQLEMNKLREELLASQKRLAVLESASAEGAKP